MFCGKCFARLDASTENCRCPRCERPFNPAISSTYRTTASLTPFEILLYIIFTSCIALAVAYVASLFQLASMSGH